MDISENIQPANSDNAGKSSELYIYTYLTENDVKELGIRVALAGENPDNFRELINDSFKSSLDVNNNYYNEKKRIVDDQIIELQESIEEVKEENSEIKSDIRSLQVLRETLSAEVFNEIERRTEREIQFIKTESNLLIQAISNSYQEIQTEVQHNKSIAQELVLYKTEHQQTNEANRKKLFETIDNKIARMEEDLESYYERLRLLRKLILSDKAASLLVSWGYIYLPGMIYFLSVVLQHKQDSSTGHILHLQSILKAFSKPSYNDSLAILFALSIIFISLFVIVKIFELMDRKVRAFDPEWKLSPNIYKQNNQVQARSASDSSMMDGIIPDLSRSSYKKFLAVIPYFVALCLLIAFVKLFFQNIDVNIAGSGSIINYLSLSLTYVLVLLATSLFYTYFILIPRIFRLARNGVESLSASQIIRLHWEVVLVIVCFLIATSLAGFVGKYNSYQLIFNVSGLICLCFSTIWISYGIAHRSLLADTNKLQNGLISIRLQATHYQKIPTLWDYFSTDIDSVMSDRIKYHDRLRSIRDEQRIQRFSEETDRSKNLISNRLNKLVVWISTVFSRTKPSLVPQDAILQDSEYVNLSHYQLDGHLDIQDVPPYLARELSRDMSLKENTKRLQLLRDKFIDNEKLLKEMNNRLNELRNTKLDVEKAHLSVTELVNHTRIYYNIVFESAYILGKATSRTSQNG